MTETYDVVVIGSGVAGLSAAMRLAMGGAKVVVLERSRLASGSTSRASGLIGQMRSNVDSTRLIMDSVGLLREIEDRFGRSLFHQTGSVRVAQTPARVEELQKDVRVAREAGLAVDWIDPPSLEERLPLVRTEDVLSAVYVPTDGYLEPPELAEAYLSIGRQEGVRFIENSPVESVLVESGKLKGVRTATDVFSAPNVVNAGGPWSYLVAAKGNSRLPTAAVAHYYFTTLSDSGVRSDPGEPTLRDRENRIYSRPRKGALRVGIYETSPVGCDMERLPDNFSMGKMTAGKDHPTIRALVEASARRFEGISMRTPMEITGGIMSFTPDGRPVLGELPEVSGFFHCSGFCGHGITQSPAIGRAVAEWILEGRCRYNVTDLEADRFQDIPGLENRESIQKACLECYSNYYGPAAAR
jgi:4-methylaminobutanoate oxidase (formaldehyde-forming)